MSDNDTTSEWLSLFRSRLSDIPEQQDLETRMRELDAIDRALIEARKLRNAKAWPRSLPSELWIRIFEQLQSLWELPRDILAEFEFRWMTVTHVCSLWREIALSAPTLWTDLSFNVLCLPHEFVPDILARSHSAPLDLYLPWGDDEASSLDLDVWLAPSICQRVKSLTLLGPTDTLERAISRLPRSMPYLYHLSIDSPGGAFTPHICPPVEEMGKLRGLALTNCHVPPALPSFFRSLVRLHIDNHEEELRPACTTLSEIITLPSLETLELYDIIPLNDTGRSSFPTLPSLPICAVSNSC